VVRYSHSEYVEFHPEEKLSMRLRSIVDEDGVALRLYQRLEIAP
jgi:hypothetical protein